MYNWVGTGAAAFQQVAAYLNFGSFWISQYIGSFVQSFVLDPSLDVQVLGSNSYLIPMYVKLSFTLDL